MERCACGHDRRSHAGGRCWFSRGCARDTDPHAVCSPECKAGRVCTCEGFVTPDGAEDEDQVSIGAPEEALPASSMPVSGSVMRNLSWTWRRSGGGVGRTPKHLTA